MASVKQLVPPHIGISAHAWNKDFSMIAVSPNSNEIIIYGNCNSGVSGEWTELHTLSEHDLMVSAIDWSPDTNLLVSCSHDRNAFVWTFNSKENTWKPTLVILRVDRAATDVRWSDDGLKFAVSSGSKCISVCTFDPSNDWWVSKIVKKKFKSSVTCCAFHPKSAQLLACGSTDFKCRIYGTFASDVDGDTVYKGPFARAVEFGDMYAEMPCGGWINSVAWSPSGTSIAYAGQDSSVSIADLSACASGAEPSVQTIRFKHLPFNVLIFISESQLLAAGHDMMPFLVTKKANSWVLGESIDKAATTVKADAPVAATGSVAAARAMFKSQDSRGQAKSSSNAIKTTHKSAITKIKRASADGSKISTTALDGKLVLWDLKTLESMVEGLKI